MYRPFTVHLSVKLETVANFWRLFCLINWVNPLYITLRIKPYWMHHINSMGALRGRGTHCYAMIYKHPDQFEPNFVIKQGYVCVHLKSKVEIYTYNKFRFQNGALSCILKKVGISILTFFLRQIMWYPLKCHLMQIFIKQLWY